MTDHFAVYLKELKVIIFMLTIQQIFNKYFISEYILLQGKIYYLF